nr:hypothetical protein [Tanacetum cinerariifolium]
ATRKAKTINGEAQSQALVDGKKVVINESTIRRDFQQEDVEGVDFLPNVAIFEQLSLMGLRWGSKSSLGECWIAESGITCDNTNRNTTLSEAQRMSLRITSGVRVMK